MNKKDLKSQISSFIDSLIDNQDDHKKEDSFYSKLLSEIDIKKRLHSDYTYYLINGKIYDNVIFQNLAEKCYDLDQKFDNKRDFRFSLASFRSDMSCGHDLVDSDKFTIKVKNNIIDYKIGFNTKMEDIMSYFDYRVRILGLNSDDIKFIEGLILLKKSFLFDGDRSTILFALSLERLSTIYEYR